MGARLKKKNKKTAFRGVMQPVPSHSKREERSYSSRKNAREMNERIQYYECYCQRQWFSNLFGLKHPYIDHT